MKTLEVILMMMNTGLAIAAIQGLFEEGTKTKDVLILLFLIALFISNAVCFGIGG